MKRLRVSIVDDEQKRHKALKERWLDVFSRASLSVEISAYDDFSAVEEILGNRPHACIVDNVVEVTTGNRTREIDNRGIDFIAENKNEHQDTFFILSTKESFSIDVLGNKLPNPDLIVPKTLLASEHYRKALGEVISRKLSRAAFTNLNIPQPEESAAVDSIRPELESIIEQCLFPFSRAPNSAPIQQVNLKALGGGYSGSKVYKLHAFDTDNRKNVALVFKLSEGDSISREVACYNSFVRLQMPHDLRVDLLGYGEAGTHRGALYAFAFGDTEEVKPLSSFTRAGDYSLLAKVVNSFFHSESIGWYKRPKFEKSVESFYSDSEEYSSKKDAKRLEALKQFCKEQLAIEADVGLDKVSIGGIKSKFIRKQLWKFDSRQVPTWICHGDFNTNNILVGRSDSSVAVIDFEYSGPDCAYKDFISLECSLRVDDVAQAIGGEVDLLSLAEAEFSLLSEGKIDSSCGRGYLSHVASVRQAARTALQSQSAVFDEDVYSVALGFHLLKLIGISTLDVRSRFQLLAAFIAVGRRLEQSTSP